MLLVASIWLLKYLPWNLETSNLKFGYMHFVLLLILMSCECALKSTCMLQCLFDLINKSNSCVKFILTYFFIFFQTKIALFQHSSDTLVAMKGTRINVRFLKTVFYRRFIYFFDDDNIHIEVFFLIWKPLKMFDKKSFPFLLENRNI